MLFIVPLIVLKRIFMLTDYGASNCGFPSASAFTNRFLPCCDFLECFMTLLMPSPIGSSLFALVKKC